MNTHTGIAVIFNNLWKEKENKNRDPCLNLCLTHTLGPANYSIFVCNTGNGKYTIKCVTAVIKPLCTLTSKVGVIWVNEAKWALLSRVNVRAKRQITALNHIITLETVILLTEIIS